MNYIFKEKKKGTRVSKFFFGLFVTLILSSCVTQKKIEYLQQKGSAPKDYTNSYIPDYHLQVNDEVVVQISSFDDMSANLFSSGNSQGLSSINPYGASLMSRGIDKDGYLELPVIGKIFAKDKTISELINIIKESLANILNQPIVSIKLVNKNVTVLGEVKSPGHYPYTTDKLSIFQALGMAGDIGEYGNHKSVILIRNENEVNKRIELNLLDARLLSSEYYYVNPGDVIYVKPYRSKFWGFREFPFSVVISTVTASVLILNYLNTLK